ncbi:unnamed protein product, partial [Mesorhabditis belari]|uniref:RNA helicase n=1 Tax=Mesorhabditis belari TaxID=2138241 RepID=A0AAF3FAW1_9BILA
MSENVENSDASNSAANGKYVPPWKRTDIQKGDEGQRERRESGDNSGRRHGGHQGRGMHKGSHFHQHGNRGDEGTYSARSGGHGSGTDEHRRDGGFGGGRPRGGGYGGGRGRGDYSNSADGGTYRNHHHDEQNWGRQNSGGYQHVEHENRGGQVRTPLNNRWKNTDDEPQADVWSQQLPRDESSEQELFSGMNSGINFNSYDEIPVEATGENVPQPATLFSELKLHQWVNENIKLSGYERPTPVQKYSIPALMDNRDLMSCAQTGSGKTAAFLVPLINHILQNGPKAVYREAPGRNGRKKQFPCALVLSPTRELSLQIYNECRKFGYRTPITSAILYGGRENYQQQISKLRLGCHILIATPGRLIDVMEQGYIGLTGCRYLVIDEADRMLDMGFEPQIRQIVELSSMPEKKYRVTAMFSATFPKEIQILAQDFLVPNYVFLAVGRVGSTSANIIQKVVWVEDKEKLSCLMDLLDAGGDEALTVVFVETKRGASDLQNYLDRKNYGAVAIHGDLKQFDREQNLERFRSGKVNVMVATAVAARGLDIPSVKHCILGIGRTGRAGNIGLATTFFNDKNTRLANELIKLMIEANQEIPEFLSTVSNDASRYGQANSRGRGSQGGSRNMPHRDYRIQNSGSHYEPSPAESSRNGFRPKPTQNKDWWD